MEETRIDRLEVRFDELAAEMRDGRREFGARLCKIESRLSLVEARLDLCAPKSGLRDLRIDMVKNNADIKTWVIASLLTFIAINHAAVFGLHHWSG